MRRTLGVVAIVIALAAVIGPGAAAHVKKYKTQISIFATTVAATGSVSAGMPGPDACRQGRLVTITQSGQVKGTATTDANGGYYVAASYNFGVPVVASVDKQPIKKNARHKHICTAASNSYTPTM